MKVALPLLAALCAGFVSSLAAQTRTTLPTLIEHPEQIALKHPTPPYPKTARVQHISGSGVFQVEVDVASGQVIDATIVTSTGSKLLDRSAVETLRTWQFRPNTIVRAKIPISFRLPPKH